MSIKRIAVIAIVAGALIGLGNWALDELLLTLVGHGHRALMFLVDMSLGMVASMIALSLMWWARERKLRILSRIEKVGEINHHIRNALYTIALANQNERRSALYQAIHDAVDRIEWTLQEYLPSDNTPPRMGGDLHPKAEWATDCHRSCRPRVVEMTVNGD